MTTLETVDPIVALNKRRHAQGYGDAPEWLVKATLNPKKGVIEFVCKDKSYFIMTTLGSSIVKLSKKLLKSHHFMKRQLSNNAVEYVSHSAPTPRTFHAANMRVNLVVKESVVSEARLSNNFVKKKRKKYRDESITIYARRCRRRK
jgi:hypothetical protein